MKHTLSIARGFSAPALMLLLSLPLSPVHAQAQKASRQLEQVAPVNALPGKSKRWALIIGVDNYTDAQISPLKGADNDARSLSDALVHYAGFPQDQVILLATNQPAERQPTRINILRRLSNLAGVVPKDGLLLISFAGHGIDRGGEAYLIPSDSQISDDINLLQESAVSVTRVKDRIRSMGVSQVIIFLDACRNDPGGRADAPNPLTQAYINAFNFDVRNHEVSAFATLYATAVGQRAYEYTEKKQGYFTWALVEGLKGAAANDKGEVTLASLIHYVQETVPKHVAIDLGVSKQQRPFSQMEGYRADELVLAVGGSVSSTVTNLPSTPQVDPTAVELSYWETIKDSRNADDFKSYLDKYPDGQFAALAHNRLKAALQPANSSADVTNGSPGTVDLDSINRSNNLKWPEFRSDMLGFLIEIPGNPKRTSRDLGEGQKQTFFTLEQGPETYLASVIELNARKVPANPDETYLGTLLKAYAEGSKATLRSSRMFTWAGRPAIEGIAQADGATHVIDITTAGDRVYLVVYAGPKAQESAPKATHMRDSFRLLGK